jgi:hypothetical protein
MNETVMMFGRSVMSQHEIENKRVIEVGSYNTNGSYQTFVMDWLPAEYVATDIQPCNHNRCQTCCKRCNCVTHVVDSTNLVQMFGPE